MLPQSLLPAVLDALHQAGDRSPIKSVKPVKGGYVSQALRLWTRQSSYLVKWNRNSPDLFTKEARSLALLAHVGSFRVPAVLAAADAQGDTPCFIVQEWIEASRAAWRLRLGRTFGAQLARLHRANHDSPAQVPGYGLDFDTHFGVWPQLNAWDADWTRFWREQRLRPQIELAARNALLTPGLHAGLERLLDRLAEWFDGVEREPALLHGDLWSGNVLCDAAGAAVLIDPCLYYGDREAELAYIDLYGDFPPAFYWAYDEVWPPNRDRGDRRDLYNLYHFLGKLNARGPMHVGRVEAVVHWYVGT